MQFGKEANEFFFGDKNGNIYYFAVAAYSSLDERIVGVLSKEVYARPLRKVK